MSNAHPKHAAAPDAATSRAFTLIELLVVITVIVVLLSMLLPAVQVSLENASFAVCQSNQRQLAMASHTYAADYYSIIPDGFTWVSNPTYGTHCWHTKAAVTDGLLWSYLPKEDIYLCRSFTATYMRGAVPNFQCGDNSTVTPVLSYSMNAYLGTTGWNGKPGVQLAGIKRASKCLFFGEEDGWIQGGIYAAYAINNGAMGYGNPIDCIATYHYPPAGDVTSGSSSAVFVDGHAEKVWNYQNKALLYDSIW